MLSVIRDGPCDLWGMSSSQWLAAPNVLERGHLMIWPLEAVKGGRVEAALADETSAARS